VTWHSLPIAERFLIREKLIKHMHSQISGFEIKSKKESSLMKFLGELLFFNSNFMKSFVTTLYPKVYVPELPYRPYNHLHAIQTLAHEYVHLRDRKKLGLVFNFLYLSPQILSLLGILGFFMSPWFLLFFLFLLPVPSPGRTWAEIRGYRMSLAVYCWALPDLKTDFLIRHFTHQFTSSNYYWMMPFPSFVEKLLRAELGKIKKNSLSEELKEIKLVLGI
jgi:hypothetical protein